jgi:hypothetical protein
MEKPREGMLRPEFQDWYPTLAADRWYPADELTDLVLAHLRHGSPQWRPQGRIPNDDHFVFRGGTPRQASSRRTRRTDRAPMPTGQSGSTHSLDS